MVLGAGESIWIEWELPTVDIGGSLFLDQLTIVAGSGSYAVEANGGNIGAGSLSSELSITPTSDVDTLRLNFTSGSGGVNIFTADSVTASAAVPEPSSLMCLSLVMLLGVGARRRTRRRT